MKYTYDIVLSFAGEQRAYVEEVAQLLKNKGVNVFYDEFNEIELWGKDLIEYFDKLYQDEGRYCIMFISKEYIEKHWPSHERRSAFARALRDRKYLLPVRFDDASVPGLPNTVYFMDARKKIPEDIAYAVMEKLDASKKENKSQEMIDYRTPKIKQSFNPYEQTQDWIKFICSELKKRSASLGVETSISIFEREGKTCIRVVVRGETIYSLDIIHGAYGSDKGLSFCSVNGEIRSISPGYNAFGEFKWSQDKNEVVMELHDMSFLEMLSNKNKSYTRKEFLEAVWDKICTAIEKV